MLTKILIVGGSGFVGRNVADLLGEKGFEVWTLSRKVVGEKRLSWQDSGTADFVKKLQGFPIVINLAGEPIWRFWRRKAIWESRVGLTEKLVKILKQEQYLIQISGINYYPADQKKIWTEEDQPVLAKNVGFLTKLCRAWEGAALKHQTVTVIRLAMIDDPGGFLDLWLRRLVKLRFLPWFKSETAALPVLKITDLARAIVNLAIKPEIGLFNAVSEEKTLEKLLSERGKIVFLRTSWLEKLVKFIFPKLAELIWKPLRINNRKFMDLLNL